MRNNQDVHFGSIGELTNAVTVDIGITGFIQNSVGFVNILCKTGQTVQIAIAGGRNDAAARNFGVITAGNIGQQLPIHGLGYSQTEIVVHTGRTGHAKGNLILAGIDALAGVNGIVHNQVNQGGVNGRRVGIIAVNFALVQRHHDGSLVWIGFDRDGFDSDIAVVIVFGDCFIVRDLSIHIIGDQFVRTAANCSLRLGIAAVIIGTLKLLPHMLRQNALHHGCADQISIDIWSTEYQTSASFPGLLNVGQMDQSGILSSVAQEAEGKFHIVPGNGHAVTPHRSGGEGKVQRGTVLGNLKGGQKIGL